MRSRDGDADASGEGTSWLVLRYTPAEGLGLLANSLRDLGIHHRYLDLHRGDPLPRDLRGVGGLIVLGGPMGAYEGDKYPFLGQESGLIERAITAGRPVLGICLGLQLALEESEEDDGVVGLGLLPGRAQRLREGRVPRIGWATVEPGGEAFYFAHSYAVETPAATARSEGVVAVAESGSFVGVQFHPEKSGAAGLRFLERCLSRA